MMALNPKVVAANSGVLLEMLSAIGDSGKFRELLQQMHNAAQATSDRMDEMTAKAQAMDAQEKDLAYREQELAKRLAMVTETEAAHGKRAAELDSAESNFKTRMAKLRELAA
jgi:uncharacterized protein involved in exopolysaccharide biosynthesis